MKLKLVKATEQYKDLIFDMMDEWTRVNERIVPYAIIKYDYNDYDNYQKNIEVTEPREGLVLDSTYFCLDEEINKIVGAVNIRHSLNEKLLLTGGHIGDGIRPSCRRKGYATEMIKLALDKCKELNIDKVLMTCNKDNIASSKTIIKNGGVFENEVEEDGEIIQRYWINNK